jgi:hypothetical protein
MLLQGRFVAAAQHASFQLQVCTNLYPGRTILQLSSEERRILANETDYLLLQARVVARLVWKSEMAHSSGWLTSSKPAAHHGGHRRDAPWASISGLKLGRLTATRGRWAS